MHRLIERIIDCPQTVAGSRCGGGLVEESDCLVCQKCRQKYPISSKGIPIFNGEDPNGEKEWYDGNYRKRSLENDLALGAGADYRVWITGLIESEKIHGPSLDVGCGTGILARTLPDFIGLDYSHQAVTTLGSEGIAFVVGSAETLPFHDAAFGCVFSVSALEHVPKVDLAFLEIDRVLQPNGVVVMRPAWHCTRYQTELLPIKRYGELNLRQKVTKALMPVLTSRIYKFFTHVPARIIRRLTARRPTQLSFVPLTPNFSQWIADSDACSSIDCHEGILFFESRGYAQISHRKLWKRILAGHDWIVMRKPAR